VAHFGVISPPVPGHLNPFIALSLTLCERGHRVTFLQMADVAHRVQSAGLGFRALGAARHPPGTLAKFIDQLGRLHGLAALRHVLSAIVLSTETLCEEAPDALRDIAADVLLVDQTEPAGAAIAQHLDLPYITVCNALMMNRESRVPPPFTPWLYRDCWWARLRNALGYRLSDLAMQPVWKVLDRFRGEWHLPPWSGWQDSFSPLAQIGQQPPAFDFPRSALPGAFHYVGPLRHPLQEDVPFPWERLDGRPLVYGSLGTLQGSKERVFRCFAEACEGLGVQLVLSHGCALGERAEAELSRSALVVSYAPQTELLRHAVLAITHAGLNTVLDALTYGVPLVAVPLALEQPAIAARVAWTQSGEVLPLARLSTRRLRTAVRSVLENPSFREGARRVQRTIETSGGARRAADIIEQVIPKHRAARTSG
jgi:UDP:flavonoid glycosyltransferase YjiC (YdhE family)